MLKCKLDSERSAANLKELLNNPVFAEKRLESIIFLRKPNIKSEIP